MQQKLKIKKNNLKRIIKIILEIVIKKKTNNNNLNRQIKNDFCLL